MFGIAKLFVTSCEPFNLIGSKVYPTRSQTCIWGRYWVRNYMSLYKFLFAVKLLSHHFVSILLPTMKASKTSSKSNFTWWQQVVGFLILPTIGLYIIAYQLLGKRYTYRRGNVDVTPLEPITRNEYLFTRLFPAGVILISFMILLLVGYLLQLLFS